MSSPSRLRALRPYVAVALVPAVLAVLLMGLRLGGLLGVMWAVLVGTVALAATTTRPQPPAGYDPGARLRS